MKPAKKPAKQKAKKKTKSKASTNSRKKASPRPAAPRRSGSKPRLLSGGNPQIAKGDGDGPVQAYLAAVPGWKQEVAREFDALVCGAVPGVRKAVKWNSPFYGIDTDPSAPPRAGRAREWFLSFHCFTNYIKVGFFRGALLRPPPPGESTQPEVRYLNIHKGDWGRQGTPFAAAQVIDWVKQASSMPGIWM